MQRKGSEYDTTSQGARAAGERGFHNQQPQTVFALIIGQNGLWSQAHDTGSGGILQYSRHREKFHGKSGDNDGLGRGRTPLATDREARCGAVRFIALNARQRYNERGLPEVAPLP